MKYVAKNIYQGRVSLHFTYAKRHKKLPAILSRKEIAEIIAKTRNAKHKLLIALSYGAGLRVSEVVKLKVRDIDVNELTIYLAESFCRRLEKARIKKPVTCWKTA